MSIYKHQDMSQILSLPSTYSKEFLNYDRVFPLIDNKLQGLIQQVNKQAMPAEDHNFLDQSMTIMNVREVVTRDLFNNFKTLFQSSLESSPLNDFQGLNSAYRVDICLGCTQYIDSLYMRFGLEGIQVLEREYTYHQRLNANLSYKTIDTLEANKPLIISQPFFYGKTHEQMNLILDCCLELNIPVHVDGAWITACKNISVNFNHPAIRSFAVSMSKGYGLSGWNRIGVRWTKEESVDAITIMNDFVQIPAQTVAVGLFFLKNVKADHLWLTHVFHYNTICKDFGLTPTDSIHLAMDGDHPIGVEALLRYLEKSHE